MYYVFLFLFFAYTSFTASACFGFGGDIWQVLLMARVIGVSLIGWLRSGEHGCTIGLGFRVYRYMLLMLWMITGCFGLELCGLDEKMSSGAFSVVNVHFSKASNVIW
jgi:hypothetical protein